MWPIDFRWYHIKYIGKYVAQFCMKHTIDLNDAVFFAQRGNSDLSVRLHDNAVMVIKWHDVATPSHYGWVRLEPMKDVTYATSNVIDSDYAQPCISNGPWSVNVYHARTGGVWTSINIRSAIIKTRCVKRPIIQNWCHITISWVKCLLPTIRKEQYLFSHDLENTFMQPL